MALNGGSASSWSIGESRHRPGQREPRAPGGTRALWVRGHVPGAGERRAGGVPGHRDRVPPGGHRCLRDRDQRAARLLQAGERGVSLREGPDRGHPEGQEWGAPGEDHQQPPPLRHPVAPPEMLGSPHAPLAAWVKPL